MSMDPPPVQGGTPTTAAFPDQVPMMSVSGERRVDGSGTAQDPKWPCQEPEARSSPPPRSQVKTASLDPDKISVHRKA